MPITKSEFDYIRGLVRERSALVLDAGKEYLVESRLGLLASREGFPSLRHMFERLRSSPAGELHRKVVEAMATNETSFFREVRTFEIFKTTILPKLLALRASDRSLSLWCAASSGGQEPYSFAMLLREHVPSLRTWNIKFIASDISQQMLTRARAGRFNQVEINRGLPAHLLVKYFEKHGSSWEISQDIRCMIEFREINLIHSWPSLPVMDIIFMRNIMIYLDLETKRTILRKAARLLKPHGYLLLGASETTMNIDSSFEPVSLDGAKYFRLKNPPRQLSTNLTT